MNSDISLDKYILEGVTPIGMFTHDSLSPELTGLFPVNVCRSVVNSMILADKGRHKDDFAACELQERPFYDELQEYRNEPYPHIVSKNHSSVILPLYMQPDNTIRDWKSFYEQYSNLCELFFLQQQRCGSFDVSRNLGDWFVSENVEAFHHHFYRGNNVYEDPVLPLTQSRDPLTNFEEYRYMLPDNGCMLDFVMEVEVEYIEVATPGLIALPLFDLAKFDDSTLLSNVHQKTCLPEDPEDMDFAVFVPTDKCQVYIPYAQTHVHFNNQNVASIFYSVQNSLLGVATGVAANIHIATHVRDYIGAYQTSFHGHFGVVGTTTVNLNDKTIELLDEKEDMDLSHGYDQEAEEEVMISCEEVEDNVLVFRPRVRTDSRTSMTPVSLYTFDKIAYTLLARLLPYITNNSTSYVGKLARQYSVSQFAAYYPLLHCEKVPVENVLPYMSVYNNSLCIPSSTTPVFGGDDDAMSIITYHTASRQQMSRLNMQSIDKTTVLGTLASRNQEYMNDESVMVSVDRSSNHQHVDAQSLLSDDDVSYDDHYDDEHQRYDSRDGSSAFPNLSPQIYSSTPVQPYMVVYDDAPAKNTLTRASFLQLLGSQEGKQLLTSATPAILKAALVQNLPTAIHSVLLTFILEHIGKQQCSAQSMILQQSILDYARKCLTWISLDTSPQAYKRSAMADVCRRVLSISENSRYFLSFLLTTLRVFYRDEEHVVNLSPFRSMPRYHGEHADDFMEQIKSTIEVLLAHAQASPTASQILTGQIDWQCWDLPSKVDNTTTSFVFDDLVSGMHAQVPQSAILEYSSTSSW